MGTEDWHNYYEPGHSKEEILAEFNLHREKWWNYYARGRWLAEGGFWKEAAADFKTAISKRSKDQRGARSYGLHFWDYFPHREVGVAYYHLGKYKEALAELRQSLDSTESAKAKFYINKVRRSLVLASGQDLLSPVITISSHTDGQIVRSRVVKLSGRVKDDSFVGSVWVGDKRLFIELSEKEIDFSENVHLRPGNNRIVVKAVDLAGREAKKKFNLRLDARPPVIYFDDVVMSSSTQKRGIFRVAGVVLDNYGVKQVVVNGESLSVQPSKQLLLDRTIDIAQLGSEHIIAVKAVDMAGNQTLAKLELDRAARKQSRSNSSTVHLAMIGSGWISFMRRRADWLFTVTPTDKESPRIVLAHDLSKPITIYDEAVFIDGRAYDPSGIRDISIAGESIPPPPNGRGKHAFFNHEVELNLDKKNSIAISVSDTYKNKSTKTVYVTRKVAPSLDKSSRYRVAFPRLKVVGDAPTAELVHISLRNSLDERFNFVARDPAEYESILREMKLSTTGIVDAKSAIRVGKIKSAEGVIFGKMSETSRSISVEIKLVDTETTEQLAYADVYDEDKSDLNLRWLMGGLAQKLKRLFPLMKGKIIAVAQDNFKVDFGSAEGARVGMRLLPYREHTTAAGFTEQVMLGILARITSVDSHSCLAKIAYSNENLSVRSGDLVIVK